MAILTSALCQCTSKTRKLHAEGRIVVCDACGKPTGLPFCVDCKWYLQAESRWDLTRHFCAYPLQRNEKIDLVTGETQVDSYRLAADFRQDEEFNCGTRARYFERRDK